MQLSNIQLRLGSSQPVTSIIPMFDVTPPEILVLQRIHGDDAVVNVRPTKIKKNVSHAAEFERLAVKYEPAASEQSPGDNAAPPLLASLFPGAMKRLPTTLKEIGMGHLTTAEAKADAAAEDANIVPDEDGQAADEADQFDPPAEPEGEAA